jgi:hypothetical protein
MCTCVSCGDCGGSGQVEVRTGSYPEWDLESCSNCRGSGVSEMCESCQYDRDLDEDQ